MKAVMHRSILCLLLAAFAVFSFADGHVMATKIEEKYVGPLDSALLIHGARYVIQHTVQPNSTTKSQIIAADFAGFAVSVAFTNTENIAVLFYQAQKGRNANRFNVTLREADADGKPNGPILDWKTISMRLEPKTYTEDESSAFSAVSLRYPLFTHLNASKRYIAKCLKSTEPDGGSIDPQPNFVEFHGFSLATSVSTRSSITAGKIAGNLITAAAGAAGAGPVVVPIRTKFDRRIEFVGDSITCGWCNLCHLYPGKENYDAESYALSWAQLTCEAFQADCHTESWSGYGMARNCCGGNTILPEVYLRALGSVPGSTWSFPNQHSSGSSGSTSSSSSSGASAPTQSHWASPQAVVINLGTNDWVIGPNISANYTRNYLEFIHQAVQHYGTETHFFLACGPMTNSYCPEVHEVINKTQALNYKTHFLDHRNLLNSTNQCCGHPDVVADKTMADRTIETIKTILGW
jgi:hypothetical protein